MPKSMAYGIAITLLVMAACNCAATLVSNGICETSPDFWVPVDQPNSYDCLLATVTANPTIVQCVADKGSSCKDDKNAAQCFQDCGTQAAKVNKSKPLTTPFVPKATASPGAALVIPPVCVLNASDGVCDPRCENTDLDAACVCNNDGVCGPGEGCNCSDCGQNPSCAPLPAPGKKDGGGTTGGGTTGGGTGGGPCPGGGYHC
jgi:hypothetical protein